MIYAQPLGVIGPSTSCGFTLLELMISVAILAIVSVVAAPALNETLMNVRMTAVANDLMTDLAVARSEAVKRNIRSFICTSSDGVNCTSSAWSSGWIIVLDTNNNGTLELGESQPIKVSPALASGTTLAVTNDTAGPGGTRVVVYRPSGVSTPGTTVRFDLCDVRTATNVGAARANLKGRRIEINSTGRPVVMKRTCP